MKYEKGKKITDNCQFKKGKKYISQGGLLFTFSHISGDGGKYFKDEGQGFTSDKSEYNCIGFDDTNFYEAIEKLPDEGLVVYKEEDVIIYRTGEKTGYGFSRGKYKHDSDWSFGVNQKVWRAATEEEEDKFIELLKKECERRGLFEDTKIKASAHGGTNNINRFKFRITTALDSAYNKNGCIFHKGKFAEPLEETTTLSDKITELIELGRSKGLKINVTIE